MSESQVLAVQERLALRNGSQPVTGKAKRSKKAKSKKATSQHEARLIQQLGLINAAHLFEREARFDPIRRWRLDFLAHSFRIAIEVHGKIWGGRHTRPKGFTEDRVKINRASELGITVLEYTPEHLTDGSALRQIQRMLRARGWAEA